MITEAIRIIVTLGLAVSAVYLGKKLHVPYVPKNLALILFIIIGTGLGYVTGGIIGRRIAKLIQWVDEKTRKISSTELISGVAGLILGLVVAALIAKPLESLLKPVNPVIPYAITLTYFCLAYLGFTLFINRQLDFNLPAGAGKTTSGNNVLDTSVIIDGRIGDIAKAGFIQGTILAPRFVLGELQTLADSSDDLRRAKGRRGLDILDQLRKQDGINVKVIDADFPTLTEVDDKLVQLCKERQANLITNDYNLAKIALLEGISIMNLNDLTAALKLIILPGENFRVTIIKEGKEKNQGVGYLDDGTMIVVQQGKDHIGQTVEISVTSVLQTSAGKLIFATIK